MMMAPTQRTHCMPQPPFPPKPLLSPEMIDRFQFSAKDKNKDGALSFDEWIKSTPNATQADAEKFKRYDTNKDGKVDQQEYMKGRAFERWIADHMRSGIDTIKDIVKPGLDLLKSK